MGPEDRQRVASRVVVRPVEDQDAVEVVELVLRHARRELFEIEPDVGTRFVLRFDRDRRRPLDGNQDALERETAFVLHRRLVRRRDDARVDERAGLVLRELEDEEALEHPDLRRGEADAVRLVHEHLHLLRKSSERVVEHVHLARRQPQHRVRVLTDLGERDPASRLRLRVELLLANLARFLRHARQVYGHTGAVDRRERQAIMSEGAIRHDDARDRAERQALELDAETNPLIGEKLRRRARNFTVSADRYVASLGGPLPWMQRLRQIEDETAAHEARLGEAWLELARECNGREFARRWRAAAERWNFAAVNQLIERHNRNYPAEARLPMNPRTGDFVPVNGKPYRREPLDARWVLERFPPNASEALRVDVHDGA